MEDFNLQRMLDRNIKELDGCQKGREKEQEKMLGIIQKINEHGNEF